MRPSSRDSQSEYSNPTSFSSQEPVSSKQSPKKQNGISSVPAVNPSKQVQKKRSGFFSNSPFRRKSKHEKEPLAFAPTEPRVMYDTSATRQVDSSVSSPTRRYAQGSTQSRARDAHSGSPEPVDPRANFQLNVGNNVFDVASPDTNRHKPAAANMPLPSKELDPIAQALAELKGIGKQSSVRMSADRYIGISTPAPEPASSSRQNSNVVAIPPPSYNDPPTKRLDPPQPAFTSKQMKQTTQRYIGQNQNMYGSSRPGTRSSGDIPRATSPVPIRSASPKPAYKAPQDRGQGNYNRSASPNPYALQSQTTKNSPAKPGYTGGNSGQYSRHTSPGQSPAKPGYANGSGRYSRHGSPRDIPRAVSPQPQYARHDRPNSSGGSMALQLSGGVQRPTGSTNDRPATYYGQRGSDGGMQEMAPRDRSKSISEGRQYTKDGRPILQFGKRSYVTKFLERSY